jgi:hypothetical protein
MVLSIRNGSKLAANGDNTMRTIITLSGLALLLSGAALATPVDRSGSLKPAAAASDHMQNYYRHKRYYRHDQDRARNEGSGPSRLQDRDRDGVGTARPEVRKPAVRPEPAVFRGPVVRERPQIVI